MKFDFTQLKVFIITQKELQTLRNYAYFLGISTQALYQKINNRTPFKVDEIAKTKKAFKLSDKQVCEMFFKELH